MQSKNVRASPKRFCILAPLENQPQPHPNTFLDVRIIMESVKDEFEGFGEGFDGFPKRLPDDCVEYTLFIVDPKLKAQKELLARLEAVRREALKLTRCLLKEYIWQRDGFNLDVESGKSMQSKI